MPSRIPTSLWLGFVLIVLSCLSLIGLQLFLAGERATALRQNRQAVLHTYEVITTAQVLLTTVQNAERGQRTYLITGNSNALAPYNAATAALPGQLAHLQSLTADNPEQQRRMPILKNRIDTRLQALARGIDLRQHDGFAAAQDLVQNGVGLQAMNAISDIIDAAVASENKLLDERIATADREEHATAAGAVLAGLIGALLMAVGIGSAVRGFRHVVFAEKARLQTAQQFEALVNGLSDIAIFLIDREGNVLTWNAAAERLNGYPAGEVLGRNVSLFFTEEDREGGQLRRELDTALQEGKFETEAVRVRRDGSRFVASVIIEPLRNEAGELIGYAKITRDITERVRQQEAYDKTRAELAQSQKLDALGQLAGGIAHDFNNLLQTIIGGLEVLRRRISDPSADAQHWIEMIRRNADRATTLTQRLLAFSRRQPLNPKALDVNRLVNGVVVILRQSLGETVAIETVIGGGVWLVHADANELETAILNLALNARDAMPNGGKLTIETSNTFLDEAYAAREETRAGQYVMVAVSDSGTGMTREVIEKAFEPFFTTKEIGKGTGLGLSQVHGFTKQSGGHAKIYSEPGEGTTVKIYLPRLMNAQATEDVSQPRAAPSAAGETILVVEDDNDVRTFTVAMLTDLGYRVVSAANGIAALELLGQEDNVDLLLTDVGLPGGMNGRQLSDEVRKRRPTLPVLYMTGYARNAIVHHGRLDPGVELIVKPFSVSGLADKVRGALAAAPSAS